MTSFTPGAFGVELDTFLPDLFGFLFSFSVEGVDTPEVVGLGGVGGVVEDLDIFFHDLEGFGIIFLEEVGGGEGDIHFIGFFVLVIGIELDHFFGMLDSLVAVSQAVVDFSEFVVAGEAFRSFFCFEGF